MSLYKYLKEREQLVIQDDYIPTPYVVVRTVARVGDAESVTSLYILKCIQYQVEKRTKEGLRDAILLCDRLSRGKIEQYITGKPDVTSIGKNRFMIEIKMGYKEEKCPSSTSTTRA